MSDLALALWSFPVMLGMIFFLRIPVAAAMAVTGFCGVWMVLGSPNALLAQLKTLTYATFASYSLSIVPLFLLMGQFATKSGLSRALFVSASDWLGHRPGGVGMAAVGACAGFGAICGSSLATASTMGQVALPELKRYGYTDASATGLLAAGGTLGILIPPSVILVIYAILTEQNIIKMFTAALIPGILAALGYMAVIWLQARLGRDAPDTAPRQPYAKRFRTLAATWPVFGVFAVVIGGIYLGFFTPTEAAAVGAVLTGLYALGPGRCSLADMVECLLIAGKTTGMIFLIVFGAALFNSFLAFTRTPDSLSAYIVGLGYAPVLILIAILTIYLVFGCVMDSLSMILLTIPVFFPIVEALDFGLTPEETAIWFGVLVLIVVEVGLITPPVGLNLFVINSMARDVPITATYRGVLPFVAADLIRVVLLVAAPILSLWLVRVLF
ncbi:MAG: TRAP transporter large permease [Silicimonas sp.]|nr:TRAP transporter large permease [Silicimonas sp.]